MKIAVSELIVRFMERLGIGQVFGMPGAHILPVYDRLYDSPIKSVLVKHEQGASFMACGYTRASGRISACIATAGPGATNLITGIANAYAEKLPILIVTGETSTFIFGKGGLQESSGEGGTIDQVALFRDITRYRKSVERTDYLAQVLKQAAKVLRDSSTGPVLLSIPYNVQKELVEESILDDIPCAGNVQPVCSRYAAAADLARMIVTAQHPVIVAGHGCFLSAAQDVLQRLSTQRNLPVATTLKAKGLVDESSPLALGCLGVTSDGRAFRHIVDHADLVIFLGAGFNERTSYLWDARLLAGKRVVQVDHDDSQLEKVFKADLAIRGDIRAVLEGVLQSLDGGGSGCIPSLPPRAPAEVLPHFTVIARFFAGLVAHFPQGTQIFDDNIILAQTYLKASPQHRYYPNTGISSLGYAIPAAIGARCIEDVPTFAILGDGGFQMCCMELMTAVNYGLPLNVVMINNGTLGLIRKNQFQLYQERYIDCDFVNPDYALLARSFGIGHWRIETGDDVDRLFTEADLAAGINLIEIAWDKNVFPAYKVDR
ncbi:MAG: thiamine pyrophosphate-binding protein [Sterolibacteriaceae bacterium MAG5]|nr:thiamine pyrophosphate-binding protein [Candidatus Nitricoxidireducens bremensis]